MPKQLEDGNIFSHASNHSIHHIYEKNGEKLKLIEVLQLPPSNQVNLVVALEFFVEN